MILLVETPGTETAAWKPLIVALQAVGEQVQVVAFPCSGNAASFSAAIERAEPDGAYILVAHGIGATLALNAEIQPVELVLLGPVLGYEPSATLQAFASAEIPVRVDLDPSPTVARALGIAGIPLGCVASGLAADIQGWMRSGRVPLQRPTMPVTVFAAPLDEIAPVELLIPAARALATHGNVRVVRLGLGDFASADVDHAGLLTDRDALRRIVGHAAAR